jgi:predicted nucleic acid-binding protein
VNSVDTNILVYSLLAEQSAEKHYVAVELLVRPNLSLSSQVVNELATALRRKGRIEDKELRRILDDTYFTFEVIDQTSDDIFAAFSLREKYNFSYWDSLIVSTALRAEAEKLFTEDMQHGLVVEGKMTIWNPFL